MPDHAKTFQSFLVLKRRNRFLLEFTRNLYLLLRGGVILLDGLRMIHHQVVNKSEQKILHDLILQLRTGHDFSSSLKQFPYLFNHVYCSLIEIGELTGQLNDMLFLLLEYLEKIARFRKKIIQVLAYPFLVVVISVIALMFMFFFVIPAFNELFKEFDSELPGLTRLVMIASEFVKQYSLVFLGILVLSIFIMRKIYKIEHFKYLLHKQTLRVPLWGQYIRKNHLFHFCRTLGTLLIGGVNLLKSLETIYRSNSNFYLKAEILRMHDYLLKGEKFSHTLLTSSIFPPVVIQMISVGEESGNMAEVLLRIANYYEQDIDYTMELLSSIIEPLIILSLGLIIGLLLIAIYLPLFNLTQLFPG